MTVNCLLFCDLTNEEKSSVLSKLDNPVKFNKGDELYKSEKLAVIIKGSATIKRINSLGESITIRTISSGELFGAASVFNKSNGIVSSVTADTVCDVLYISREKFSDIIMQYPKISINYIKYLSDRICFLNRKLDAFTASLTEEKLYEYLLSLSDGEGNVNLKFGMAELARRLNVGRTSLYRDISSLTAKELIIRNGHNFKILK